MEKLEELNGQIDKIRKQLVPEVLKLKFENPIIISKSDPYSAQVFMDRKFSGLYLIDIKNTESKSFDDWFPAFKEKWEGESIKSTPRLINKRVESHFNSSKKSDWIPIYLGKAKNVADRVKSHFELKSNQQTTGLKLNERKRLSNEIFRIRTISLNFSRYDIIAPIAENEHRDEINPIIGRQ